MVEKSDSPPASGQLLAHGKEPSREPDLDTTQRFTPRVEPHAAGPTSQRSATVMLPDSRRDPSCVQARTGAPVSERMRRPGFMPVPRTQLLGTLGREGSDPHGDKAAREAALAAAAASAALDTDLPPPRSVIRSRPWVEIPDGAGSGIRSMPELEANAPSMVEEPAPPSRRLGGRARRAMMQSDPDAMLQDLPPMSSPRVEPLPSDVTGSLTIPGISEARARRERLIFGITFGGAILSVIAVSIWLWGSGDPSASAGRQGATLEALASATAATAAPPPRPVAAAKAPGNATTRPMGDASAKAPAASPARLPRKGQKPLPAGSAPRPRSQNEVVDPWDN